MPFSVKSMRLGCASESSTAVYTSGTKPFHHRVHSYLADQTKSLAAAYRKSFSFNKRPSVDAGIRHHQVSARRHSSADVGDYTTRRKSSADVRDLMRRNPVGSSGRLLLSDTASFRDDLVVLRRDTQLLALEMDVGSEMVKHEFNRSTHASDNGRSGFNQLAMLKSSLPTAPPSKDQVVVLRVSLHCKGCEAKLRKHISKMEGVTSFDIEFETKKVTVIGKVSPLYVLNSITKVKNAQFWPSPTSSTSSSSSSGSTKSQFSY